ncbi:hypothetical protein MN2019_01275 [Mycolicibacterium neoaurum]|uniref:hypothetical protein n=1 Tax=Mycolicibacterium neoaurum TaxID=1795 RepID=UPI001BD155D9|nr:hypothetical protein [Mycolicibacterium neoaurum]QVI28058.1 hypothetical protein MN2019_01275 [Mycolicibacterium neoaurum]
MLLTVLKVSLVVFIGVAVLVFIATYVRKSKTTSFRTEADPNLGSLSQMGVVPPTPLPEWAYWEDGEPTEPPKNT